MVYVKRRAHFSASHRLYNPAFSDRRNQEVFDKCNNPNGHGHNYVIDVVVRGLPQPDTGYVIDLKVLADIMEREIIQKVDHKHLNYDVEFLRGIIPTAENIAIAFWRILEPAIPSGELYSITVRESDNNSVEYFGEPVTLVRHDLHEETLAESGREGR
jgi:6-pyruvoyltetrahydropterin/6-carboxytetrahydropterin synthase